MNLKKFAIRGIVILAVFVALCMFFSGTVRSITTPKVSLTKPKRGKFEEQIDLAFKPAYPNADKITVELEDEMTLTIVKVDTREGYTVEAGDLIYEAKVTNYDQLYKQYQDAYDAAAEQMLSLENKNKNLRITQRDEAYADAYFALRDARRDTVDKELKMDAQLSRENLSRVESGYPDGASSELKKLIDDWRAAVQTQQTAQSALEKASRYNVDDSVWSYITDMREQTQKRDDAEKSLRKLVALNDRAKAITAPHAGYVAELTVKEGENYDGAQPLYSITLEGELPTLRADINDITRTVSEGMTVAYNANSYEAIETRVVAVGTDSEGKKYAEAEMTPELIKARGSVYAMTQEDTTMTLVYRAREATTLVPTSAVGGSGDDRYVYIAEQGETTFGGSALKVHKMKVKVLGESNGITSLQEDLSYYTVAYGADRPISDGVAVMEYAKKTESTDEYAS